MQLTAPRFDWSFNFGHVLQTLGIVVSVIGGIWWISTKVIDHDNRIKNVETAIERQTPKLEGLVNAVSIQDVKFNAISSSIRDNKETTDKVLTSLSALRESMADVRARMPSKP